MATVTGGMEIDESVARSGWTFLSNHAKVLTCLADDPTMRLRDVAATVGITERAAQSIVADLADGGYVTRTRVGRRNHYTVHDAQPLRDVTHQHLRIGGLLGLLRQSPNSASSAPDLLSASSA